MNRRNFFGKVLSGVAMLGAGKSMVKSRTFADGGVFNGPTLGLIGEGAKCGCNPVVIAPLSKLKLMVSGSDIRKVLDRSNSNTYLN